MTRPSWFVLVVVGVLSVSASPQTEQAPLSSKLLEARLVFLSGQGIEREWIDRAAEEIQKIDRFQLTATRGDADLVFILATGQPGESVLVPLTGGGAVAGTYKSARLVVQDPIANELLWDDSRVIYWRWEGAVADLVKDLHSRIDDLARSSSSSQISARPDDRKGLLSVTALRCKFEAGTQTDWKDGAPSSESARWRNSLQVFDTFDRERRTARLIGNTGATANVALVATSDTLTFIEVPALGAPNMTTVFAYNPTDDRSQFVAVTSRHVTMGTGVSPFPSQFYGTCAASE